MNSVSIRVLFQCHNRRGLGHLMRGLNIAEEIRKRSPAAEVLFYTKSDPASWNESFQLFVETDEEGGSHWPEAVRSFSPNVIVYDTILPESRPENRPENRIDDGPLSSARRVYIMRKSKEEKQQEIFMNPFLETVDRILIPHTLDEFSCDIPPSLKDKSVYVGPIVRLPDPKIQAKLREKYGIGDRDFLLTSTAGGGGFTEQAELFFETVYAVHRQIHPRYSNFRHLVVLGPNFQKSLSPLEGMTVIRHEPEISNLFALSRWVIAEGGYNTVNEIRAAKTAAVFLPSDRKFDDQEERVRALEKKGLAVVFSPQSNPFAGKIAEVCSSESALRRIKSNYETDQMETGNRVAAEKILELAAG